MAAMLPFVEPRFQRLGNTFVNDPFDVEEDRAAAPERAQGAQLQPPLGRPRRPPERRRSAEPAGAGRAAAGGPARLAEAGAAPPVQPRRPGPARPARAADGSGAAGAICRRRVTAVRQRPRRARRGAAGRTAACTIRACRRRRPRAAPVPPTANHGRTDRSLYDSAVPQTRAEGGAGAAHGKPRKDRSLYGSGVPQTPAEDGAGATPGKPRATRGGKSRSLNDWNHSPAPSAPGSPAVQKSPAKTMADLLRTGSTAMMKAATLAHKMNMGGDAAKGWGSTCSPAESPTASWSLGAYIERTPTACAPVNAPAAPSPLAAAARSPAASWSVGDFRPRSTSWSVGAGSPECSHPFLPMLLGSPLGAVPR
ncbi:unnamed protein product [Prorocentrum cordatum]|uniref:Uncharacterized protein n=1 Tax=Prorocentrum cordatum TaxID=2364126 RepID=A0ABN9XYQ6_9DINO|nr:unnamed protein product [Polarella glacialis]